MQGNYTWVSVQAQVLVSPPENASWLEVLANPGSSAATERQWGLQSWHTAAARTPKLTQSSLFLSNPSSFVLDRSLTPPNWRAACQTQELEVTPHHSRPSIESLQRAAGSIFFISSLLLKMSEMDHHKASWYMKGGTVSPSADSVVPEVLFRCVCHAHSNLTAKRRCEGKLL